MSTRKKAPTIGELNNRALRDGKKLGLHEHDEVVRAHLEELADDWQRGLPLDEEDRNFLMWVALDYVFPGRRGAPVKRDEQEREAEAKALIWGRRQKRELLALSDEPITAEAAAKRAAEKVLDEYPELFRKKSGARLAVTTIVDRINRRVR